MTKTATKSESEFKPVKVTTGPLGGMVFTPEDHTETSKATVRVKYVAPNNGPRTIVEHRRRNGKFDPARMADEVRIAFSKLIPGTITWDEKNGYSDRKSGTALEWDRQLARFVNRKVPEPVKPVDKPSKKEGGEE